MEMDDIHEEEQLNQIEMKESEKNNKNFEYPQTTG